MLELSSENISNATRLSLDFSIILPALPFLLSGVGVTLKFTSLSLVCGLPLGIAVALCKIQPRPWLRSLAAFYTSIFRGTPLLVQLGIVYFGLPQLLGWHLDTFAAGVLTFSLNSAAYTSEVMRSGIEAVDQGQWEAATVLGLGRFHTFVVIILPQAVRIILPNLISEWIDLLKESALVATIGEMDLFKRTQIIAAEKYLYFEPYLTAACLYYLLVMMLSYAGRLVERKLRLA